MSSPLDAALRAMTAKSPGGFVPHDGGTTPPLFDPAALAPSNATRPAGTPTERLDRAEMDALVGEWLDERGATEKHAAKVADVAAVITAKLRPGEQWEVVQGVGCKIISARRSFDEAAAAELLTDEDLTACQALSWTAAKALLKARGQLDACMRPGTGNGSLVIL